MVLASSVLSGRDLLCHVVRGRRLSLGDGGGMKWTKLRYDPFDIAKTGGSAKTNLKTKRQKGRAARREKPESRLVLSEAPAPFIRSCAGRT